MAVLSAERVKRWRSILLSSTILLGSVLLFFRSDTFGRSMMSVFTDGTRDPDEPTAAEDRIREFRRQSYYIKDQPTLSSTYKFTESGQNVQRLTKILEEIKADSFHFAAIDNERMNTLSMIAKLKQQLKAETLQAEDVKEDLSRLTQHQQDIVNELAGMKTTSPSSPSAGISSETSSSNSNNNDGQTPPNSDPSTASATDHEEADISANQSPPDTESHAATANEDASEHLENENESSTDSSSDYARDQEPQRDTKRPRNPSTQFDRYSQRASNRASSTADHDNIQPAYPAEAQQAGEPADDSAAEEEHQEEQRQATAAQQPQQQADAGTPAYATYAEPAAYRTQNPQQADPYLRRPEGAAVPTQRIQSPPQAADPYLRRPSAGP